MLVNSVLLSFNYMPEKYSESARKATSSASVAFFFTYMFIFGASANCIPWVYVPEILPLHARGKGTAVGISANWLWNFVVVMITPTMIANVSTKPHGNPKQCRLIEFAAQMEDLPRLHVY